MGTLGATLGSNNTSRTTSRVDVAGMVDAADKDKEGVADMAEITTVEGVADMAEITTMEGVAEIPTVEGVAEITTVEGAEDTPTGKVAVVGVLDLDTPNNKHRCYHNHNTISSNNNHNTISNNNTATNNRNSNNNPLSLSITRLWEKGNNFMLPLSVLYTA